MDKLELKSKDLLKENIEKIKELFPEVFSEDKIDFEKLKEVLGEFKEDNEEKYSFNWNGKAQAKRMAQTSTSATLKPNKKESKDWDKTQNLYIEGDNLEVLKILQTPYYGKVKMIYIDPPYNTGKDFVYRDNFKDSIQNYLEQTGQVDDEGNRNSSNTEQNGRYHTDWLNMMFPRLLLARNLLKEDGVIFISIDDHEVHNLRKVCDEVFGEGNFVGCFIRRTINSGKQDSITVAIYHEYLLAYCKDNNSCNLSRRKKTEQERKKLYPLKDDYLKTRGRHYISQLDKGSIQYSDSLNYPIIAPDGTEIWPGDGFNDKSMVFRWSKEKVQWGLENDYIVFKKQKDKWKVYAKSYEYRDNNDIEIVPSNPYTSLDYIGKDFSNFNATPGLQKIFDGGNFFNFPKPVVFINDLIKYGSKKNDIIFDFFSGSATTAHAVMQLNAEDGGNRKYIMVQLPEKTKEGSEAYKAGYKNICEIGKERIRRAGEKIKKELEEKNKQLKLGEKAIDANRLDVGFRVFKLSESNLESSIIDPNKSEEEIKEQLQESLDIVKHSATEEDLLYEILLKYKIELTEPIKEENVLGKKVYVLGEGLLFICLDKELSVGIGDEIGKLKEKYDPEDGVRVVFRDEGFKNSEEKLNVFHTLKNYGINDVKSI